jgi:hypothetical protein
MTKDEYKQLKKQEQISTFSTSSTLREIASGAAGKYLLDGVNTKEQFYVRIRMSDNNLIVETRPVSGDANEFEVAKTINLFTAETLDLSEFLSADFIYYPENSNFKFCQELRITKFTEYSDNVRKHNL